MSTKKEMFINEVSSIIQNQTGQEMKDILSSDALDFWNGLNAGGGDDKPQFTANGKLVLKYMQENKDTYNNLFKAKDVGEGLSISSRTASGAMRKLVSDSYIEKVGENPVIYSLTQKGSEASISADND